MSQPIQVDLAALQTAIKAYNDVLDDLGMAHARGIVLTEVEPAGRDKPSEVYATTAKDAGEKHQLANKRLREAVQERIDKLQASLDQYKTTDQGNADNLGSKG